MDDAKVVRPVARSGVAWVFFGDDGLRAGWSLALFALIIVLLVGGIIIAAYFLYPPLLSPGGLMTPGHAIEQESVSLAVVGVASAIMSLVERRRFSRYGLRETNVVPDILKGLASGIVMLSLLIGLLWVSGAIGFDGVALKGSAILSYGLQWLVAFALVGLFEEFGFRGYLQFTLARGVTGLVRAIRPGCTRAPVIGFWTAALAFSILLFALAHTTNQGESAMGIVAVGLAGAVFVFSLWWTGSLWWAVGFHTAWDWAQSYLYGVADSGFISQGHLLASHAAGSALLSGGTTGPEGSLLVVPVMLATLALIAMTVPRRLPAGLESHRP